VHVVASPEVAEVVAGQGGRLYVWPRSGKCCLHGLAWLEAGANPRDGFTYDAIQAEGFELQLARMATRPDELHLDVSGRRRRRVNAYWDNCAYVV
jgi:hypothetical protein